MEKLNCTNCKLVKELCEFRERQSLKRGYQSWCKDCEREAGRNRYVKKEGVKIVKSKEELKLINLRRLLLWRYNLDYDDYIKMYEDQKGKCAICAKDFELGGIKGLHVDHNHNTKEVRGCRCNTSLGRVEENPYILLNMLKYLGYDVNKKKNFSKMIIIQNIFSIFVQ